jgi:hypothetical protein
MTAWWFRLRKFLCRLVASRAVDRALDEEIQSYIAHDIEARIRSGLSPAEARRLALADFGGVGQVKEQVRDTRAAAWLDGLCQDIRYATRTLAKAPGFSLSVVGSLSLGVAAMVATIAFVNGMFFRPFPGVADQERLVEITRRGRSRPGRRGGGDS